MSALLRVDAMNRHRFVEELPHVRASPPSLDVRGTAEGGHRDAFQQLVQKDSGCARCSQARARRLACGFDGFGVGIVGGGDPRRAGRTAALHARVRGEDRARVPSPQGIEGFGWALLAPHRPGRPPAIRRIACNPTERQCRDRRSTSHVLDRPAVGASQQRDNPVVDARVRTPQVLRGGPVDDARQDQAPLGPGKGHVHEPFFLFAFFEFHDRLDLRRGTAHPGQTAAMLVVDVNVVGAARRKAPGDENERSLQALRLVDRHDLHRTALAVEPLQIAFDPGDASRLCDEPTEFARQIAKRHVPLAGSLEQQVDDVHRVGELSFPVGRENLAAQDARLGHDAFEESIEAARVSEGFPRPKSREKRMTCRQVARPFERRQRQPEERSQPDRKSAGPIVGVVDRRQQSAQVLGRVALEQSLVLVECARHTRFSQRRADHAALARRARQHEDVAVRDRCPIELPGTQRIGSLANLTRDRRPEGGTRQLVVEPKDVERRDGPILPVNEGASGSAAGDGPVTALAREHRLGRRRVEEIVGRLDERARRPVVDLEGHELAAPRDDLVPGAEIGIQVSAPKPIDRLLWIADQKQVACGPFTAAPLEEASSEDRPLRLVGILKLVDQRVPPTTADGRNQGAPARTREGLIDEHEHVVEVVSARVSLRLDQGALHGGKQGSGYRGGERWCATRESERGGADPRRGTRRKRHRADLLDELGHL